MPGSPWAAWPQEPLLVKLISVGCSGQHHAGRRRQGFWLWGGPRWPGTSVGLRGAVGIRALAHGRGSSQAPAGAQPIVQQVPTSKWHLSLLSRPRRFQNRALKGWAPLALYRRTATGLFREARRPHVPASAPLAYVSSENKRRQDWPVGVHVQRFYPFIYWGNVRLLPFSAATGGWMDYLKWED